MGYSYLCKQIVGRHESITPAKIVAELTLGFWVSLLNSEYERLLWKDLRRAFPYMPKSNLLIFAFIFGKKWKPFLSVIGYICYS